MAQKHTQGQGDPDDDDEVSQDMRRIDVCILGHEREDQPRKGDGEQG